MSTAHTPGPWFLDKPTENAVSHIIPIMKGGDGYQNGGHLVAEIPTDESPASEDMANAHLIAAAPELFAALDLCFRALKKRSETNQKWTQADQTAYEAAQKALWRATE